MSILRFHKITARAKLAAAVASSWIALASIGAVRGQEPAAESGKPADAATPAAEPAGPIEGHSVHGEVFNEGPRQAARLMSGVGVVRFPVTTANDDARRFVEQGVAQLHGFWYFESERSFRQAAKHDPDCAIAYWGMAMSNRGNEKRAKSFIAEAVKRKDKAGRREQLLIEAFERFISEADKSEKEKKDRASRYVADLEDILIEFPDDIETKAFLCEYFWSGKREGLEMPSHLSVNAMIQEVLDVEPLHPVHHYRIHLWDGKKPELALQSAAQCGLAAPGIAHMWHMPGHIYSKLRRYHDAVYQQEASARVDHALMMADHILPDQIHNFAHNNEWCIRNLISIGRVHDAETLARNMISLPQHPKYNTIGRGGSFKYGRERLLDVLTTFELYETLASLNGTVWLADTGDTDVDQNRDRAIGAALAALGRASEAATIRDRFQQTLDGEMKKQADEVAEAERKAREARSDDAAIEKAKKSASDKFSGTITRLQKAIDEINGRAATFNGDHATAADLLTKAGVSADQLALALSRAGRHDEAVARVTEAVNGNREEVRPLAAQIEVLFAAAKKDEAKAAFEQLRPLSSAIDIDAPPFARLTPIATEFGFGSDWRVARVLPSDIGARPNLDALGPFQWSPTTAADWTLPDVQNQPRSLRDYRGKPVIVVFYLGYGCLHCAEQLQAIAKAYPQFEQAGLSVIAVSTDKSELLANAYKDIEGGFPFPLVADPEMSVFKQYRCFDDFEQAALHGTFLIDATGRVRWQDISFDPFKDTDFLLKESQRLLKFELPADSTPLNVATAAR